MSGLRAHNDALLVALRADTQLVVYDADEAPASPTYPYVSVSHFARRYGDTYTRISDSCASAGYRVVVLAVGSSPDEARWATERVEARLECARLVVTGYTCSACRFESASGVARDPDMEDLYVGSTVWTFVSTALIAA